MMINFIAGVLLVEYNAPWFIWLIWALIIIFEDK